MTRTKKEKPQSLKTLTNEQILAALNLIQGDGHTIWKVEAFEKIWPTWAVQRFSQEIESDTSSPMSTVFGHSGEVIAKLFGIYGLTVLYGIASDLGVKYESKFGRGSQAREIDEAVRKHFAHLTGVTT